MSLLFSPIILRNLSIKNRIWVSPMCQYSSQEGMPTDWHLVHLGSRAVGGAGLVMAEATAVSPEGRISPDDSGIWSNDHIPGFRKITQFIKQMDSVPAIQLAHAGRKASTDAPWRGAKLLSFENRGWETLAPSAVPYKSNRGMPREMTETDICQVVKFFEEGAIRSLEAGFQVVELHMAHGYLLHEFLSPLSNFRKDQYGGSFENRIRFPLEVATAVRKIWPADLPVFVRISATDWIDGAWDLQQSVQFSIALKQVGIDLIDCSTGGIIPQAPVPVGPSYQVPFAKTIRREAHISTGAVGMITQPHQAESILTDGAADAIFLARELLRDPYWPLHAAKALNEKPQWPKQYERASD